MTKNMLRGLCAALIGVVLMAAGVRTQNRAAEREAEVKKLCVSGTGPAGNSGGGAATVAGGLAGRFGVRRPEATVVAAPGASSTKEGTAEFEFVPLAATTASTAGNVVNVTVKGKFPAGTHFVFQNDGVQVVKETVNANSYQVSVRILPTAGPGVVELQAFSPQTCQPSPLLQALLIGGKYAWDLAGGGWKLQLRSEGAGLATTSGGGYQETYTAEFFRNNVTTPFSTRKAIVKPVGEGLYTLGIETADLGNTARETESVADAQQRIMKRMMDPAVSDAEKEKLSKEFGDLLDKLVANSDAAVAKTNIGFICQPGSLQWDGKAAKAKFDCSIDGQPFQTLNLTGTLKAVR